MGFCLQRIIASGTDSVTGIPFSIDVTVAPIVLEGNIVYIFHLPVNGNQDLLFLYPNNPVWIITGNYGPLFITTISGTEPYPPTTNAINGDYLAGESYSSYNLNFTSFQTESKCFVSCITNASIILFNLSTDTIPTIFTLVVPGTTDTLINDPSLVTIGQAAYVTFLETVTLQVSNNTLLISQLYYGDSPNYLSTTQISTSYSATTPYFIGFGCTDLAGTNNYEKDLTVPVNIGVCLSQIPEDTTQEDLEKFLEDVLCIQTKLGVYADQYATKISFGVTCCETLNKLTQLRLGLQILNRYDLRDISLGEPFYNVMTYAEILLLKNKLLTF